jgi:hypothetical protein
MATLKMEVIFSFVTSVQIRTTRRFIPEDCNSNVLDYTASHFTWHIHTWLILCRHSTLPLLLGVVGWCNNQTSDWGKGRGIWLPVKLLPPLPMYARTHVHTHCRRLITSRGQCGHYVCLLCMYRVTRRSGGRGGSRAGEVVGPWRGWTSEED